MPVGDGVDCCVWLKRALGFRTLLTSLWKYDWKVERGLPRRLAMSTAVEVRDCQLTEETSFVLGRRAFQAPIQLAHSRPLAEFVL